MASETIVAVFRTAAEADAVTTELHTAGVPANAIQQHVSTHGYSGADATLARPAATDPATTEHKSGLWAWLLGEEHYQDEHTVYDDAISGGGVVLSVIVQDTDAARIVAIIERHHPIDIDEKLATSQAATKPAMTATTTAAVVPGMKTGSDKMAAAGQVIGLAEESLTVGKREVDRGTARIRRYVVERPVEEQVRLRTESLRIERRPVSGDARVAADAFSEKVIEVRETAEEAVVGKTARVVEEVVIGKDVGERVETVRDTVRREEIEVSDTHGEQKVATQTAKPGAPSSAPLRTPAPATTH